MLCYEVSLAVVDDVPGAGEVVMEKYINSDIFSCTPRNLVSGESYTINLAHIACKASYL